MNWNGLSYVNYGLSHVQQGPLKRMTPEGLTGV